MKAILFKHTKVWVLQKRMANSCHAISTWQFTNAKEARSFAKEKGMAVKRATNCDA